MADSAHMRSTREKKFCTHEKLSKKKKILLHTWKAPGRKMGAWKQ